MLDFVLLVVYVQSVNLRSPGMLLYDVLPSKQ